MQPPARVALAVGSGYLLGRTRKLKLALSLGGLVLGKRLVPVGVLRGGLEALHSSPEFDEVRERATHGGRSALAAAGGAIRRVSHGIATWADALEGAGSAGSEKAPAKKTPAKKTPAKKTPAKKTPAKKTPAKKTPAKKTPAKKTPAN